MSWANRFGFWVCALACASATPSAAQGLPDFGPAPTQQEFYEAADRSAYRLFRARTADVVWREARRGFAMGNPGYIACGDVQLADRTTPVTVMAIWRRGDIDPLFVTWRYDETDPYSSTLDLPGWVSPLAEVPRLCAAWTGDERIEGLREGERFAWSPSLPSSPWRLIRREDRRLEAPDAFARVGECFRTRTRSDRRYRLTVEAAIDTRLSVLSSRQCSGRETVIRWNEDVSPTDHNPQVEFNGMGTVYVYVNAGIGSSGEDYTFVAEERDLQTAP